MRSAYEPIQDQDRDQPQQREQWFLHGRIIPGQSAPGQSAATLRYRAHLQKMHLRAARLAAAQAAGSNAWSQASSGTTWTALGPAPLASDATGFGSQDYDWVSGRATAVAVDPADITGNTVYVGGAYSGVWKSTNAGPFSPNPSTVTWVPLTDTQATLAIGSIAIQPGNSDHNSVVLVGTGETNSSVDSYYGLGILRFVEADNTWTLITQDGTGAHPFAGMGFSKIAFNTANSSLVVAAAAGASQGDIEGLENPETVNRGIYYSTNAGTSWSYASIKDGSVTVAPGSVTAVVYNPTAGKFFAALRYHGIYSSGDGINWSRLTNQPGAGLTTAACPANPASGNCPIYRGEFAVLHDPANPSRNEMYAWYVDSSDNDQGIWKTTNNGSSWTQLTDTGITDCGDLLGCGTAQGLYNLELTAVPNGMATDLYAGAINLYKCEINDLSPTCSGTGSNTFLNLTHVYGCAPNFGSIAHVHPDQHNLDFMVVNSKAIMYFANDGGIYRALDAYTGLITGTCGGSNQFDSLNQTMGSMTQFVSFSQHPTDPNIILGGTQDNGSPATASSQSTSWLNVNSGDGGYNEINPNKLSEWFTANTGVSIQRCTLGIACHAQDFLEVVDNSTVGGDSGPFYTPYILDPQDSGELIVGTCRVWRGTTTGTGFTALSNNFETGGVGICSGGEVNLVRSLAAGGIQDTNGFSNVIYAGTSMISKSQEETEVSWHLEEKAPEAGIRRLS